MTATEHEIAPRSSKVPSEGVHFEVVLASEFMDFIADDLALHGQPTWRVDWDCECIGSIYVQACESLGDSERAELCERYHSGLIAPCTLMTGIVDPWLCHGYLDISSGVASTYIIIINVVIKFACITPYRSSAAPSLLCFPLSPSRAPSRSPSPAVGLWRPKSSRRVFLVTCWRPLASALEQASCGFPRSGPRASCGCLLFFSWPGWCSRTRFDCTSRGCSPCVRTRRCYLCLFPCYWASCMLLSRPACEGCVLPWSAYGTWRGRTEMFYSRSSRRACHARGTLDPSRNSISQFSLFNNQLLINKEKTEPYKVEWPWWVPAL